MLNINIEWLPRSFNDEVIIVNDLWNGDYIVDPDQQGRRFRVVPFCNIIEKVSPKYALELLSKIFDPKDEALSVRYNLVKRRVYSGQYSILSMMQMDNKHFSKVSRLVENYSDQFIKKGMSLENEYSYQIRESLLLLRKEMTIRYRFEKALLDVIDLILSDSPPFGYSHFQDHNPSYYAAQSFLQIMYDKYFDLFCEYQKEICKFDDNNRFNKTGLFGGWLYSGEVNRLRNMNLKFDANAWKPFSQVIWDDLKFATVSDTTR